jgi:hypothetical protein
MNVSNESPSARRDPTWFSDRRSISDSEGGDRPRDGSRKWSIEAYFEQFWAFSLHALDPRGQSRASRQARDWYKDPVCVLDLQDRIGAIYYLDH